MKKLPILAATAATMIVLSACSDTINEPQADPLQLVDIVGHYSGGLTMIVEGTGDLAMDTLVYPATSQVGRGVSGSQSMMMWWWAALPGVEAPPHGVEASIQGEFQGELSAFDTRESCEYPLSTRWGAITLYPTYGLHFRQVDGPLRLEATGTYLTLRYSDTIADFRGTDGEVRTLIFRNTLRVSR